MLREKVHLRIRQKFTSLTSEVQKWFEFENQTAQKNQTSRKHDVARASRVPRGSSLACPKEVHRCEAGSSEKTTIIKQQNYVYLKLLLNRKEFRKSA